MDRSYNLGDEEFNIAFRTNEYDAAHKHYKEMDCICFENPAMEIDFFKDPDGYLAGNSPDTLALLFFIAQRGMMENFIGPEGYFMIVSGKANPFGSAIVHDFKIKIIQPGIKTMKYRSFSFQVDTAVI